MAPVGTPEDRLAILRQALARMQDEPLYHQMMEQLGENTEYLDGDGYDEVRRQQARDYADLVQSLLEP